MKYLKRFESYSENPKVEIFANQMGPLKLISASSDQSKHNGFTLETSYGEFFINSITYPDLKSEDGKLLKPKPGYTYVFEVDEDFVTNVALATCDLVIFYKEGEKLQLLSIKRKNNPFMGLWANPGGFIDEGEQPIDSAGRELMEETGVSMPIDKLKFIGKFDTIDRDPRMKMCVSYAFTCVLTEKPKAIAQDDAADVAWLNVNMNGDITDDSGNHVKMAFDHHDVIKKALATL